MPRGAKVLPLLLSALAAAHAQFDWTALTNPDNRQYGDATFYGQDPMQDGMGKCSFSENYANTNRLPWTTGIAGTVALNKAQFDDGKACGACIMYRGVGGGKGTTPLSTQYWAMGFVNNECPECEKGSIDIDLDGDGRWKTTWYLVPCNVGNSTIRLSIPVYEPMWMAIVISNTRVPVDAVSMKLPGGDWWTLTRQANNMWPYHMEVGDFHGVWPITVRVTSVMGETLESEITSLAGNDAPWQFAPVPNAVPHVTAIFPGYGVQEENTPRFTWPEGAVANIGPPTRAVGTDAEGSLFEASTVLVEDGEQCGGNGYDCEARDRGQPTKPCVESVWPLARCANADSFCMRKKNTLFTCQRPHFPGTRRIYESDDSSFSDYVGDSDGGIEIAVALGPNITVDAGAGVRPTTATTSSGGVYVAGGNAGASGPATPATGAGGPTVGPTGASGSATASTGAGGPGATGSGGSPRAPGPVAGGRVWGGAAGGSGIVSLGGVAAVSGSPGYPDDEGGSSRIVQHGSQTVEASREITAGGRRLMTLGGHRGL